MRFTFWSCIRWFVLAVTMSAAVANAAIYHVSLQGVDTDPGSESQPWRTIQKAANQVLPGDTVIVHAGSYDERVVTKRGGSSEATRIEFEAEGTVVLRGWNIAHPFLTVRGFEITGHTGINNMDAHVIIGGNGDSTVFERNVVRDGISIARTNIAFHNNGANPGTIECETGGFLAAGFKPGQSVYIGRAVRVVGPLNAGTVFIQGVTDTVLTVAAALVEEAPSPVYLSASLVYGLLVSTTAESCVVRSNVFRNLSFDTWFVGGLNNLLEHNVLEACQGWDAIHFMGTNNVFRRNLIHKSPLVVYQVSPDAFENIAQARYDNIVFEQNFVDGFSGVITSEKGASGESGPLTYSHNVFVNTGSINIRYPNASFINNTFVNVSVEGNPVAAPLRHPIVFEAFNSVNSMVKNNVFVGCGPGRTPDTQGWYEFLGPTETVTVDHNFVSGPAPVYARKSGFNEGIPALSGGDPGFVDISNPLGPDGVPFTEDDGLRLAVGSKLKGAAGDGADLGAYNAFVTQPEMEQVASAPGTLTLQWPKEAVGYFLEFATSVEGPWKRVDRGALGLRETLTLTFSTASPAGFYRLVRNGQE
jgi:hypothetical protein